MFDSGVFLREWPSDYIDMNSVMSFFLKFSKHLPEETVLAQWGACVTGVLEVEHPSLGSPISPTAQKT